MGQDVGRILPILAHFLSGKALSGSRLMIAHISIVPTLFTEADHA